MATTISPPGAAILVTGGTGFLGGLAVVEALAKTDSALILPLRDLGAKDAVLATLAAELKALGLAVVGEEAAQPEASEREAVDLSRVRFVQLPTPENFSELPALMKQHGVTDVLHCAGCLSYFNTKKLEAGNIGLTQALVDAARANDVRRFVFLSTAYSAGFVDPNASIAEALHTQPGTDPTDYTRTKRDAEMIVAESGVPYVVVRPSIVVGHSRDGRYDGKPYGIYQLWTAFERFLAASFPPVLHIVAAETPVNFLHQDSFISGFWAAYTNLPDGSVVHLVSRQDKLPTMRELCHHWLEEHGGPREVHFYNRLDDVPMDEVDEQLRLWLDFTAVNSEIASVIWPFEHGHLDTLRAAGLPFEDASKESMAICEARFVADSDRVQTFIRRYREQGSENTRIVDH